MITPAERALYDKQGYIVVKNVLSADELKPIRKLVNEFVDGARGKTAHDAIHDLEPGHTPDNPKVRRIKTPHLHHQAFRDLAQHPKLVSILQALLGPAVRLHGSKINIKAPHYGSAVEWHQDWAFYPHTNDDLLAVGIMLDDCAMANGPLLLLPETHRGPVHDHHAEGVFCGAMDPDATDLNFAAAAPAIAPAGSMSFHHVRLVHGSAQNTSDLPRQLVLYEFAAADAWPLLGVSNWDEFNSRMVAGAPTNQPRVTPVPVRMPLPPAKGQGSIYENQTAAKRRYFEATEPIKAQAT
jgi:ectoine hydroxylase-related dioxygenase (phytanoyl-CoA dioxygenase family)